MNVKCHCNPPASQPPRAIACGIDSSTFCCGIFGPKLGNAMKIWMPLMASTVTATAFAQCVKRTAHGCSKIGWRRRRSSEACIPAVALIAPVALHPRQHVGDVERHEVLRVLVAK